MTNEPRATGDAIPEDCQIIEVRVAEIGQLFNTIDPTPFHQRDLDPSVEEFIVDWAREIPSTKRVALLVYLDRPPTEANEAKVVRDAVDRYFARRASAWRIRLRRLFRQGRISLAIGVAVLATLLIGAQYLGHVVRPAELAQVLHESLLIGGWVAMWRPLEIFLYDWWPIRAEARMFDRLARMPVRLMYEGATKA